MSYWLNCIGPAAQGQCDCAQLSSGIAHTLLERELGPACGLGSFKHEMSGCECKLDAKRERDGAKPKAIGHSRQEMRHKS
jgi:hypothetical protein